MKDTCGCCEGTEVLVPAVIGNRPGLDALYYRIGTHGSFLETMKARLSSSQYPVLQKLTTREGQDASIALLDAWATVADVLTFYQERIANEGYLRTATERRSILELARLIGYRLRPGVSASVYLAFSIEDGFDAEVPRGTRANSMAGQGESSQPFETSELLKARSVWNTLKPRLTQPQYFTFDTIVNETPTPIYLDGTTTNLKPNSPLLVSFHTRLLISTDDESIIFDMLPELERGELTRMRDLFRDNGYKLSQSATVETVISEAAWTIVDRGTKYSVEKFETEEEEFILNVSYPIDEIKIAVRYMLFRTLEVEVNQEAKRTRVMLMPWTREAEPGLEGDLIDTESVVGDIVDRYIDLKEFGLSTTGGIALEKVVPLLTNTDVSAPGLKEKLAATTDNLQELEILNETILQLQKIFDALDVRTRRLREWLSNLIAELQKVYEVEAIVIRVYQRILEVSTHQEKLELAGEALAQLQEIRSDLDIPAQAIQEWLDTLIFELKEVQEIESIVLTAYETARELTDPAQKREHFRTTLDDLEIRGATLDLERKLRRTWFDDLISELREEMEAAAARAAASITVSPIFGNIAFGGMHIGQAVHLPLPPVVVKPPAVPLPSPRQLPRDTGRIFASRSDMISRMLLTLNTGFSTPVYMVWAGATVPELAPTEDTEILKSVEALRVTAGLFGRDAPPQPFYQPNEVNNKVLKRFDDPTPANTWNGVFASAGQNQGLKKVLLDKEYDQITPGSWIVIERLDQTSPIVDTFQVEEVQAMSMGILGTAVKVTQLTLTTPWVPEGDISSLEISTNLLRKTNIYAQPELLPLAELPIVDPIEGDIIELAELYDGLEPGRWLIISGERADIQDEFGNVIDGIMASERVLLDQVIQDVQHVDDETDLPGDHPHTFLQISPSLAYKYKPETVRIYANVVKATHGETLSESFGSGDGSQVFQTFELRQTPLTYVAAPTTDGIESSLVVRVNDVQWREAKSLADLGPKDRGFVTRIDDDGKTSIIFGNGKHGARPPTGIENIKGKYRRGIGKAGNARAEQIKLLATKPLHVKSVINPLRASGGADPESRDQARKNAPLVVSGFDRLVSVKDYEDFARRFAGIGKASAVGLSDRRRGIVHLTIAGADDIPIDEGSDLFLNLRQALQKFGDPFQPVVVALRALSLLVIRAKVQLLADYAWEFVEPKVRAAMLESFSFERRELGQDVTSSEVIGVIQSVEGVSYVDLETLDAVDDQRLKNFLEQDGEEDKNGGLAQRLNLTQKLRLSPELARFDPLTRRVLPAQIAYLDPTLPDTLILMELQA